MHFIIAGTVLDGVEIHGPFADDDAALEWADSHLTGSFQLFQPTAPENEEKSAALIKVWDAAVAETYVTDDDNQIKDAAGPEERQTWYENDITAMFARMFAESGRDA